MFTSTLITIGSVLAGGAIAVVGVIGLVESQTSSPDQAPVNSDQSAVVDYGSN